jgi:sulfite exporter TauE/SafE
MLDLLLMMALGFLGSFGHCLGMCGPLTLGFSMSHASEDSHPWPQQLYFHGLLNLGRILSYALIGAGIGALGSVLVAGGQLAGVGSDLRRWVALLTGVLLIWYGLAQIQPQAIPRLPFLHPVLQTGLHQRLHRAMAQVSGHPHGWTPILLGMIWGWIPCGFLYAAQLKAAATSDLWVGSATMFAFGLGTLPTMLSMGLLSSLVSADRRTQLFHLGGWLTLIIGLLTLLRTGDMVDYTGYSALLCWMLTLIARPISRLWSAPLRYRRLLGIGAFLLSLAHMVHMLDHHLDWQWQAIAFLLPLHQIGLGAGLGSVALLLPLALTSTDWAAQRLGPHWRHLHRLSLPAFLLCLGHMMLTGASYLGALEWTLATQLRTAGLGGLALLVLLVRVPWIWSLLAIEQFYVPSTQAK